MRSITRAEVRKNHANVGTGTLWVPETIGVLFFANFDSHEPFDDARLGLGFYSGEFESI